MKAIIDVNAWLGSWPFQYFRDSTARLVEARLAAEGITRALVGSPEAAFNPDCPAANRLLEKRLAGSRLLEPVPAVNPVMGDWRDELERAVDCGRAAVRLFPTFHVYELGSSEALAAVEAIARAGRIALFLQMRMEDERTQHPLCKVPGLAASAITELARRFPELAVVALCPYYHEAVELARGAPNVRFEISHVERLRTMASLLAEVPAERVLFGTHAPFLTPRAALMKLQAPYVPSEVRLSVGSANALAVLGKRRGAR